MDWGLAGIILAVIFFITTIILAIRLAEKKKPVWAYSTDEIIELRKGTPPELKLLYNDAQVTGVYRTYFIFFNRGRRAIQEADVKRRIEVNLAGAQILNWRTVKQSKDTINTSDDVMMDESGPIELDFPYLDHNDGLLLEILHTKYDKLTCKGYILEAGEPKYIGKFARRPKRILYNAGFAVIYSLSVPLMGIVSILSRKEPVEADELLLWGGLFMVWVFMSFSRFVEPLIRHTRFPSWSTRSLSE